MKTFLMIALSAGLIAACGGGGDSSAPANPGATPTNTPAATAVPTASPVGATPTPIATLAPGVTATPTASPTATPSPTPTVSPTPSTTPASTSSPAASPVPVVGTIFYADPASQAANWAKNNSGDYRAASIKADIADQPAGKWLVGGDRAGIKTTVNSYVTASASVNRMPILVAYNIPGRDCGSFSAGGASSISAYKEWITGVAEGIGNRSAVLILEPDAVSVLPACSGTLANAYYQLLSDAIDVLNANAPKALVYLDAGHSAWIAYGEMAQRLHAAGIKKARGFALNVSNYRATSELQAFGNSVSTYLKDVYGYSKPFVIDTSRNGKGPKGTEWCNPTGRKIGVSSQVLSVGSSPEMNLWIKLPGESDGYCNGGPAAGVFSPDLAHKLITGS